MKEQLISFETAKHAKEKEFDWETLYYYDTFLFAGSGIPPTNWNKSEILTSAPTQSLLQKWFREVHKINVFPIPEKDGIYYCRVWDMKTEYIVYDPVLKSVTYEESLEAGLKEALKLL